ncbi:MAG: hypothetical protein P4L31_01575 [Candidatus Babeliales bacterium]|nr:hypothetical protein [Candidatus Babeliales bacterium]
MRRLPHIIILLIVALLIFALVSQGYGMNQEQPLVITKPECSLVFLNTSGSTVWVSNTQPTNQKEYTLKDLADFNAIAIAPHSSDEIKLGRWFSIYTRIPQTNDTFQLHYTIAYRSCKKAVYPMTLSMQQIEADQLDGSGLVAIDHLHGDIAQGTHGLCPHGKKPLWDKHEEQWFCKLRRRSQADGTIQYEYVPVQTYIYQFLPDWLIGTWYTQHPTYFNWYHAKPIFWQHMNNYKTPWQSDWYKEWYEKASQKEKDYLHKPSQIPTDYVPNKSRAYGLPESKMNIATQNKC